MKQPKEANKTPTKSPKIDSRMTPAEKESLVEQIEEFEGPDRREKRGSEKPEPHEPGVARS
jgi:hypothetical protein